MGVVSPIGIGLEPFWNSLVAGRSGVQCVPGLQETEFAVRFGGVVADFDGKAYVRPRKSLKVMSRDIQFGFAAADMAFGQAGLQVGVVNPDRFGVVFGAKVFYTDLEEVAAPYARSMVEGHFDFRRWAPAYMSEVYPLWMLKYLPNMPACHIGIALDARGPNNSILLGGVSSLAAIGEALCVIERGAADVMIAGGTCASRIHPTSLAFRGEAMLSHRTSDPAGDCRPFDAERDGTVNGEGAAALVLESRQHAEARGAKILGRLSGFASRFEPVLPDRPPQGTAIRSAITAALTDGGISAADVGHVNANGLGMIDEDRIEAQAIHRVLPGVPVTAPKSYFGDLGAGSGAVELAASLLGFGHGLIPPTLNYQHPDPACPIDVVHGAPRRSEKPVALKLGQSPHGQSIALVVRAES